MHYIVNENKHIIAADSDLLALCGATQINDLIENIILKNISFTMETNKSLTITTKKTEYQFPIHQNPLESVFCHFTLITIDADKQKTKHPTPYNTIPTPIETSSKPIQSTQSDSTVLAHLQKRASNKQLSPIIIDIDKASKKIGISKEDFTLFFTDYIDTAVKIESDLVGTDAERKNNAINTLSHLSGVLQLESINQIMINMKESTVANYADHVNTFYDTLARIKTIDHTSPLSRNESQEQIVKSIDTSEVEKNTFIKDTHPQTQQQNPQSIDDTLDLDRSIVPNIHTPMRETLQDTIEKLPTIQESMSKTPKTIASEQETDFLKSKDFMQETQDRIYEGLDDIAMPKETLFETNKVFTDENDKKITDNIHEIASENETVFEINKDLMPHSQENIKDSSSYKDKLEIDLDQTFSIKEDVSQHIDSPTQPNETPAKKSISNTDFILPIKDTIQGKIEKTPSIQEKIEKDEHTLLSLKDEVTKTIDTPSTFSQNIEKSSPEDIEKEFILSIKDTVQHKEEVSPSPEAYPKKAMDDTLSIKEESILEHDIPSLSDISIENETILDKESHVIAHTKESILDTVNKESFIKDSIDESIDNLTSQDEDVFSSEKKSIFDKGKEFLLSKKDTHKNQIDDIPSLNNIIDESTEKLKLDQDHMKSEKKSIFDKGKDFLLHKIDSKKHKTEEQPSIKKTIHEDRKRIASLKETILPQKESIGNKEDIQTHIEQIVPTDTFEKGKDFIQDDINTIQDKTEEIPSIKKTFMPDTDTLASLKEEASNQMHKSKDFIQSNKEHIQHKAEEVSPLKQDTFQTPTPKTSISAETYAYENIELDKITPVNFDFSIDDTSKRLGLPTYLIHEFMLNVIEQTHSKIKEMLDAYKKNDLQKVQQIAHLLKGISSNLRITPLSENLHQIQLCESNETLPTLIKEYWGHFLSFEQKVNSAKIKGN